MRKMCYSSVWDIGNFANTSHATITSIQSVAIHFYNLFFKFENTNQFTLIFIKLSMTKFLSDTPYEQRTLITFYFHFFPDLER